MRAKKRYNNKCVKYVIVLIKMFFPRKCVLNVFVANYDKCLASSLQLYPINCKYSCGK